MNGAPIALEISFDIFVITSLDAMTLFVVDEALCMNDELTLEVNAHTLRSKQSKT